MLPMTQLTARLTPQNLTTAEPEQPIRAVLVSQLSGCSLHLTPNQCVQKALVPFGLFQNPFFPSEAGEHTPDCVLFAWGLFFAHG